VADARRRGRLWAGLLARGAAAVLLAAALVVGSTAVRVWQVARQDHRPPSDVIIVLGSAQYDGRPSAVFEARLAHAFQLYEAGVAPVVVTVGGRRPGDRYTEAAVARYWLVAAGVPLDSVVAVERGGDTLQSMRVLGEVFREEGWRSAVVVTDPWHALRSERMARDQGIDAVVSPARSGPAVRTRETQLRYITRETAAYLYYRWFGESPRARHGAV
jgi:uncharacterized SAM-binding protein YcdF (DUF218 family)